MYVISFHFAIKINPIMKNRILPILILLITQLSFSQVGIGTTNPSPSSALDIRSTNSGLLIPRVGLMSTTDTNTIPNPATSLLVYNSNTSNDVMPGFYYWEGSWKTLKGTTSGSSSGWNLIGNTTTATDYLGTNNFNSLVFKVNNNPFSKYHPNGGISIGNSANGNDNNSVAIGTSANASASNQATAVGPNTTASGFQSTALGYLATASNNSTIAMGISSNASGFQSIGIGVSSVSNTNNSLAIGNSSTASGQQATAIGTSASSSGQNATAIGYQATATLANSIILGNSANTNNKIGIGTNTPDERLHVAGSVKIVDGTQGLGKVLTSDANGRATWASPSSSKSYADIYLGGNNTQTLAHNGTVAFGTISASSNINANNNNIQVITTGRYRISYKITFYRGNEDRAFRFNLIRGNTIIPGSLTSTGRLNNNDEFDRALTISNSTIVALNVNDQISVRTFSTATNNVNDDNIILVPNGCSLSVELID